jgi:hypothetical protein
MADSSRPSTSYDAAKTKDVDARDKPGQDEREAYAFGRFTASARLAFAEPGLSGFC